MTIAAAALALVPALLVAPTAPAAAEDGAIAERTATTTSERVVTMRDRVVALVNKKRRNHGCRNLRQVASINRVAQKHTKKMANWDHDGRADHQLPGESSLGTRLDNAGYRWTSYGENIAAGVATPRGVVRGWMNSPGHRANILRCDFKHTGVGYATAPNGRPYWTQDFGRR